VTRPPELIVIRPACTAAVPMLEGKALPHFLLTIWMHRCRQETKGEGEREYHGYKPSVFNTVAYLSHVDCLSTIVDR